MLFVCKEKGKRFILGIHLTINEIGVDSRYDGSENEKSDDYSNVKIYAQTSAKYGNEK